MRPVARRSAEEVPEEVPEESTDGVTTNSDELVQVLIGIITKHSNLLAKTVRVLLLEPLSRVLRHCWNALFHCSLDNALGNSSSPLYKEKLFEESFHMIR